MGTGTAQVRYGLLEQYPQEYLCHSLHVIGIAEVATVIAAIIMACVVAELVSYFFLKKN